MIRESSIEEVLNKADIESVVKQCGIKLERKGANMFACCPFHKERTASMAVSNARGTFHCFSCGEHGNAISFVMKHDNVEFPEAVKILAERFNVKLEVDDTPLTKEQILEREHRQELLTANETALRYYIECFNASDPHAVAARSYAHGRWPKDFCSESRLGFAPGKPGLIDYCKRNGIKDETLLELGLICENDRGHRYEFFHNRLMIPIVNRANIVIGFTARAFDVDAKAKYLNSKESQLFIKSEMIFGIRSAINKAHEYNRFFLVEGAPDVMRLHSIGAYNTVAALGTAWSETQFKMLQKHATRVCFFPDNDPPKDGEKFGPGEKAVMKNGITAMKIGLEVSVREIPDGKDKQDPDSYITSKEILESLPEIDFVVWLAEKKITGIDSQSDIREAVNEIAALTSTIDDKLRVDNIIEQLAKINGNKTMWRQAIRREKYRQEAESVNSKNEEIENLSRRGFFIKNGCYWSLADDGEHIKWSNFTMKPLFHIKNLNNPRRLFEVINSSGHSELVEMKPEDLITTSKFAVKLEAIGNFIWRTNQVNLIKLKEYLFAVTDTAIEVERLGHQPQGFYAFGNGCFNNKWVPADELGIVRLPQGNFYLPGASRLYADDTNFFQFERKFVHLNLTSITIHDFVDCLVECFGENAKVGFAFYLASLFRDIVIKCADHFPLLNIFGQKGSGKSKLAELLMSLFMANYKAANLNNSTIPALAEIVGQATNAMVHIDEFRDDIDVFKREFLKGIWDGTGRSRMNMDRDKKREITPVTSGVILTGQQMATADVALFSRLVFLKFNRTVFSQEEKDRLAKFQAVCRNGCSHI